MSSPPKIDGTDIKILKTLLVESRTSFTKIAKDCDITVAAVRKRYKRLWKVGIINGEIMQVNPYSLGYKCVTDIGIMTAIENEKEIIDFLVTFPFIVAIHPMGFGKYNIGATIALRDIEKLASVIEKLESNPYIKRVDTLIWAETKNLEHSENLVMGPHDERKQAVTKAKLSTNNQEQATHLEQIDKEIIKILSKNSRLPFTRIAKQLNVSTIKVIQRYKKLRDSTLTMSTITVDLRMFGYKAFIHLFIKAKDRSKMPQIYAQLLEVPNLIVAIRLIGPYDVRALVAIAEFNDTFELSNRIRRIAGLEQPEFYLTPIFWVWPLNVFAPLLEPEVPLKMRLPLPKLSDKFKGPA